MTTPMPMPRLRHDVVWATLCACALVIVGFGLVPHRTAAADTLWYRIVPSDAQWYLPMAAGGTAPSPWGDRVLVPMIAQVLPLPAATSLQVITYTSLAVFYAASLLTSRTLGLSRRDALLGMVAVAATFTHLHNFQNPFLVDAFALAAVAVALLALVRGAPLVYAVVVVVGVFARETTLAVAPALLTTRRVWATAATCAAAAVAFVLPRIGGLTSLAENASGPTLGPTYVAKVYLTFGLTWVPIFVGALLVHRAGRRDVTAFAALLTVAAAVSSAVATDTPRMYGLLQPVATVYAAATVAHVSALVSSRLVTGAVVVLSAVHAVAALPTVFTVTTAEGISQLEQWYGRVWGFIVAAHITGLAVMAWMTRRVLELPTSDRPDDVAPALTTSQRHQGRQ